MGPGPLFNGLTPHLRSLQSIHEPHQHHHSSTQMPATDETTPLVTHSPATSPKMSSSPTSTTYWRVGAIYGAAAVAFGAFGAHGLKSRGIADAKVASWSTAAHYQVYFPLPYSLSSLSQLTYQPPPEARPLRRRPPRSRQPARRRPLHGRHDHVQREYLRADFEPVAADLGPGDAHRWHVPDWGVGGAGVWCAFGAGWGSSALSE